MSSFPKNLYSPKTYQGILLRLDNLKENSIAKWRTMNAPQMLAHCAESQEIANAKELKILHYYLSSLENLIKRAALSKNFTKRAFLRNMQLI